jgi:plastocyanin
MRSLSRINSVGLVVLAAVAAASLAACGGGPQSAGGTTTGSETAAPASTGAAEGGGETTIAGDKMNLHGTKDVSGMDDVDMELDDNYFGPTILKGDPGQTLKIELENEGSTEHNFSIDDQKIDQDVEEGEDASVMVTFPDSGVLQFYCSYHKQLGMVGGLETGS